MMLYLNCLSHGTQYFLIISKEDHNKLRLCDWRIMDALKCNNLRIIPIGEEDRLSMWVVWCSCSTDPHAQLLTVVGLLSISFPLAIQFAVIWCLVLPLDSAEEHHGRLPEQRHGAASYQFLRSLLRGLLESSNITWIAP
jgi:hypothetical protein